MLGRELSPEDTAEVTDSGLLSRFIARSLKLSPNLESIMRQSVIACAALAWFVGCFAAHAQAPTTATCKDGTSWSGVQRSGACSHHGGVKAFDTAVAASVGKVWVNTRSKVYHCPGDANYAKTKAGSYMSETAAKAEGDRPSDGKVCS